MKPTNSDSKNFYSLVPNYAALREEMKKYKHKPTEEEIRSFLDFWQEIYNLWKSNNSPFDLRYVEETVKVRKSFIEKFGIRT
jgi:hypothetical protein